MRYIPKFRGAQGRGFGRNTRKLWTKQISLTSRIEGVNQMSQHATRGRIVKALTINDRSIQGL